MIEKMERAGGIEPPTFSLGSWGYPSLSSEIAPNFGRNRPLSSFGNMPFLPTETAAPHTPDRERREVDGTDRS